MFNNTMPPNGFAETGIGSEYITPKATHANQSTAAYPVGQIVKYFNPLLFGYGACVYAKYEDGSASAVATAGICCPLKAATGVTEIVLTNDASASVVGDYAAEGGAPVGFAVMTMTDACYGWFWIAGVAPLFRTAAATYFHEGTGVTSGGSLVAGSAFTASTTDGAVALYDNDGTNDAVPIGMTLAADSTNANTISNVRLFGVGWGC